MSFIYRGKLTIVLKDVTKKSVSRGKKQTNEKKQTQMSSKKTNIKKPVKNQRRKLLSPKRVQEKVNPKSPKKQRLKL